MTIRIKFRVTKIIKTDSGETEVLMLATHDKNIREDLRLSKERPYASMQLVFNNPAFAPMLKPGKMVFVEVSEGASNG